MTERVEILREGSCSVLDGTPQDADRGAVTHTASGVCEFFDIATDFEDAESAKPAYQEEKAEMPVPCSLRMPASTTSGSGQESECDASTKFHELHSAQPLDTNCPIRKTEDLYFVHSGSSLATQIQALVCTEIRTFQGSQRGLRQLLATVCGHARSVRALKQHYARSASIVWLQVNHALPICKAQCIRLKQARQVYLSVLHSLEKLQSGAESNGREVRMGASQYYNNIIKDLLELDGLRCTAERILNEMHLRDQAELSEMHQVHSRPLWLRTPSNTQGLKGFSETENTALELLHESRLFDFQALLEALHQSYPPGAKMARLLLERVTEAAATNTCSCTSCSHCAKAKLPEKHQRSQDSTSTAAHCLTLEPLLRLFEIERKLSAQLNAELKHVVLLIRLAANLASASAHLEKFVGSLVGMPSLEGTAFGAFGTKQKRCIRQLDHSFMQANSCSRCLPAPCFWSSACASLKYPARARWRLARRGVAVHKGALLRAIDLPISTVQDDSQCATLGTSHAPLRLLSSTVLASVRQGKGGSTCKSQARACTSCYGTILNEEEMQPKVTCIRASASPAQVSDDVAQCTDNSFLTSSAATHGVSGRILRSERRALNLVGQRRSQSVPPRAPGCKWRGRVYSSTASVEAAPGVNRPRTPVPRGLGKPQAVRALGARCFSNAKSANTPEVLKDPSESKASRAGKRKVERALGDPVKQRRLKLASWLKAATRAVHALSTGLSNKCYDILNSSRLTESSKALKKPAGFIEEITLPDSHSKSTRSHKLHQRTRA
ncbi:hypothetical protein cyc_07049 [Cyclospora cayetanensis]|uniref:Uncharacterized protein n=1 Tax=Cyclospora cayetanensis TaxID=88456 RepID=A0A1D3CZN0_9EIME|nr:hypothetical protein cyc_07049 [Cyclospora cayetanensis]